uniref:Putative zinc transporter 10 n=1 Tax=Populus alba TaxID=43335 RepID=A0A4U5QSI2_POPAL|nr:putative zinc transporter 10 [Populus alba]
MPNFNDSFTIEIDASGEGIGVVLSQQGKPLEFMSRALGVTAILVYLRKRNVGYHKGHPLMAVIIWEDIKQAATTYKYIQTKGRMETDHPEGQLSAIQEVDQQLLTRDALLKQLKANLENSVNCIKQIADRKRRDISFDIDTSSHTYLQLSDSARIYLVFHVSLLKRYHSNDEQAEPQQIDLPPVTDEGVAILEPQTILDTRWLKYGG